MTQQLAVFNFHGSQIRTIEQDGDLWFIGKDVAEVLGYENPAEAVRDHCKTVEILKTSKTLPLDIPPRGLQIIPERDVYRLVMRSKLPSAERFEEWVTGEVLPSIRKTGGYSMQPQELIARAVIEAQRMIDNQAAQIAELAPKAAIADRIAVADGLYNLTHAAKVIGVPPRTFNNQLHSMGWIYRMGVKGSWTGSAPKVKAGYIEHKVHQFEHSDGTPDSSPQVFITAKGIHRLASIFNVELSEAA